MEIIVSFILGAIAGGAGVWYWKRKPEPRDPGVTIQGGGGTGPRQ